MVEYLWVVVFGFFLLFVFSFHLQEKDPKLCPSDYHLLCVYFNFKILFK